MDTPYNKNTIGSTKGKSSQILSLTSREAKGGSVNVSDEEIIDEAFIENWMTVITRTEKLIELVVGMYSDESYKPHPQVGQNDCNQKLLYAEAKERLGETIAEMDKEIELKDNKITLLIEKIGIFELRKEEIQIKSVERMEN